ncbi:MarR family winged helix-turn-helix transcriptional regulator [Rhizobium sp. LjRoot98]|uniref:MarR family winged helix-turn-helix transcriptional regulator n=1 Tax=Rhizobium sp. LjRoot98 TaxID=3342345 RepID=UPI003ECE1F03
MPKPSRSVSGSRNTTGVLPQAANEKDIADQTTLGSAGQHHEESTLDPGVYEGLAGFRLAMRHFFAYSETTVTAAGITSQQYQALLAIKVAPQSEVTMKDLARQMLLQPNGAVQLVDRMVVAGLVKRTQATKDKRSVFVGLTPEGQSLLEELALGHVREMLLHEPLLAESLARLRRLAKLL